MEELENIKDSFFAIGAGLVILIIGIPASVFLF